MEVIRTGYVEVVRTKGGPRHIGKEMAAHKNDIWRGWLALGGEGEVGRSWFASANC